MIVHHHAPSVVLWNETPSPGNRITIRLRGSGKNTGAIGARLTIKAGGGGRTFVRSIDGGGGYLSSNDPRIHVGIGSETRVERAEVRWPSGKVESRDDLPINTTVEWKER